MDYTSDIKRALAEGGHLIIGRSGFSLVYKNGQLSGYDYCEKVKAEAIAAGLPVIDSRMVDIDAVWELTVRGPMIAVGREPDEKPWGSLSYAPLEFVADSYRSIGAEVYNI